MVIFTRECKVFCAKARRVAKLQEQTKLPLPSLFTASLLLVTGPPPKLCLAREQSCQLCRLKLCTWGVNNSLNCFPSLLLIATFTCLTTYTWCRANHWYSRRISWKLTLSSSPGGNQLLKNLLFDANITKEAAAKHWNAGQNMK